MTHAIKYFPQIILPLEERLKNTSDLATIGVLKVIFDSF
jgi:hypothetical protein